MVDLNTVLDKKDASVLSASIVIPAHNEANVIERTLRALVSQLSADDQVVLVCNGCNDQTAVLARQFEPAVMVCEIAQASKVAALNYGDTQVTLFPRIYLDADIELAPGALDKMKQSLADGPLLAVAPEPIILLEGASWSVRAYYDIWLALPYCRSGMIGSGVYALSEVGRKRFELFPNIIADDGYARALFAESERGNVAGAQAYVRAPLTLGWLLKILVRIRVGQMELIEKYPELVPNEHKDYKAAMLGVLSNPFVWHKAMIYLYVVLRAKILAKRRMGKLSRYQWDKDHSSRQLSE